MLQKYDKNEKNKKINKLKSNENKHKLNNLQSLNQQNNLHLRRKKKIEYNDKWLFDY